jgi:glutaredoxin
MIPRSVEAKEVVMIYFFHDNPCESCHEEDYFIDIVKRQLLPHKEDYPYEFQIYNTMQTQGREKYLSMLEELSLDKTNVSCPVMIIGDQLVSGYEEIEAEIFNLVKDKYLSSEAELGDDNSDSASASDINNTSDSISTSDGNSASDSNSTSNNNSTSNRTDETEGNSHSDNIIEENNHINNSIHNGESSLDVIIPSEESYILFTTLSCPQCEKVKKEIKNNKFPIFIQEVNIIEEGNAEILLGYFRVYQVPNDEQQVPILFYNGAYASGAADIIDLFDKDQWWELEQSEKSGISLDGMKDNVNMEQDRKGNPWLELGRVIGTSVINGLNPCALSMFFLLLSIILGMNLGLFKNGLLYLTGKVIAYFVMGIGLFSIFEIAQNTFYNLFGILKWILCIFAVMLSILNFLDLYHTVRGEYGKIRLQLPRALRKWNQSKIASIEHHSYQKIGVIIFLLGFLISLGEFFCTGQIYAATLLSLLKSSSETAWIRFEIFSYAIALCIPSLLLLIMIAKGKSVITASNKVLNYMPYIKLINGILFLFFAVVFLLI